MTERRPFGVRPLPENESSAFSLRIRNNYENVENDVWSFDARFMSAESASRNDSAPVYSGKVLRGHARRSASHLLIFVST